MHNTATPTPTPSPADGTISSDLLREVMGHFATGVAIVTAYDDAEPVGLTCQSVVSVSLAPPLVAFCPAKTSTSWPRLRRDGNVCINVLADRQVDLCRQFARTGSDKFTGVEHRRALNGAPVIDSALAHVEATVQSEHDAGDHTIVVCRVTDLSADRTGHPLLFFRGALENLRVSNR
ncbi:flavin reductase family protein [Gordonia sp. (in: high G+C Gram-positive bacteria)]|uniref:flavin reductase family protein n=1 Tax=Gordonia sp. (in: high G+C Gram-positive bacteria) TaxID=84139 RepID=UPI003F9A3888